MYTEQEAEDLKKLGKNVRKLRLDQGYSQESFADAVGLHRTYMGGVERGERNLSVINILKIARTLECPVGSIFCGFD